MKQKQICDIVVCPKCKNHLDLRVTEELQFLDCNFCQLSFTLQEGVPVMLINEAVY